MIAKGLRSALRAPRPALALAIVAVALLAVTPAGAAGAGTSLVYAQGGRFHFLTPAGVPLTPFGRAPGATEIPQAGATTDIAASRDGRRVAALQFTATDGSHGDYYRVLIYTRGQAQPRRVFFAGPIAESGTPSVALSPDGDLLAISIGPRIHLVNLVTNRRRVLGGAPHSYEVEPSFTSGGRYLVFCRGEEPEAEWRKPADVFERSLVDGQVRRLTRTKLGEYFPTLSPNGHRLAFMRRLGGRRFALVVARADDSGERTVRHADNLLTRPQFSPSGGRIAYGWVKKAEGEIDAPHFLYTVGVDGRDARLVARTRGGPLLPQWTWAR